MTSVSRLWPLYFVSDLGCSPLFVRVLLAVNFHFRGVLRRHHIACVSVKALHISVRSVTCHQASSGSSADPYKKATLRIE